MSLYLLYLTLFCCQLCFFATAKQHLIIDNKIINGAEILQIEQDFAGNFWLATTSGLYRFDGINFEKINATHLPGLVGDAYSEITSNKDYIWLASNLGLEQISIKNQSSQHLYHGPVSSLALDKQGVIWFLSQGKLHFYNREQQTIEQINLPMGIANQFSLVSDHLLWLANSNQQLFMIDTLSNVILASHLVADGIKHISVDSQARTWLITRKNQLLQIKDLQLKPYLALSEISIKALKHTLNGYFYYATNNGIFKHDSLNEMDMAIDAIPASTLDKSYIDNQQRLWFKNSQGQWVTSYTPLVLKSTIPTDHPLSDLQQLITKNITAGTAFNNIINYQEHQWFLSRYDGVYLFDSQLKELKKISMEQGVKHLALANNQLWLSTDENIFYLNLNDFNRGAKLTFEGISAIAHYQFNEVIFTTNKHLYHIKNNQTRLLYSLPNTVSDINDLRYDALNNAFLFATENGLWRLKNEELVNGKFELLLEGKITKIAANTLAKDWLLYNQQVALFDATAMQLEYIDNQVTDNFLLNFLPYKQQVLLSHNQSLFLLKPQQTTQQLTDRLRLSEVNFSHNGQNSLLFPSNTISLPNNAQNIQLKIAAQLPNEAKLFNLKYRFKPNTEWLDLAPNQATLNLISLPQGTHNLQIQNDGQPSLQTIDLTLISEDTKQLNFSLFYAALLLLAFILLFWFINKNRAIKNKTLTYSLLNQTKEAVWIADHNLKIIEVNAVFSLLTGFKKLELIGKSARIYNQKGRDLKLEQLIFRELQTHNFWSGQIWSQRKNGEDFYLDLTITKTEQKSFFNFKNKLMYIGMFTDQTVKKRNEKELQRLATRDPITGLANRTLFIEHLSKAINDSKDAHPNFALLFLDLDNFHKINESLGHTEGDNLLKLVSDRIAQNLDSSCTLARLGGDEFAILIPPYLYSSMTIFYLKRIADKLLTQINHFTLNNIEVSVSSSIGIALFPDNGLDSESLMRSADSALNYAKRNGKNSFQFYDKRLKTANVQTLSKESALFHAIENQEFILYYQPKFNTLTNKIVGYEALVRWPQADGTVVGPGEFIPIAEQNGAIIPLTKVLVQQAFKQTKIWYEQGKLEGRIAINLSAVHFQQASLIEDLAHYLSIFNISGRHFELEITESAMMQDPEFALNQMNKLKTLGFSIALDDFGTGHSSLSYLKKFPIDTLKIDRSFIIDITTSEQDRNITSTIIRLAKYLNISVVSEGVETYAQAYLLHVMGCNVVQGYYFSAPVAVQEIENLKITKKIKLSDQKAG
ncbi:EAL domain-containing protein [Pseudoalteromonas tunicata]|uniref:EAL domain-containing protein n=1 Tax=Pseudoalteromonas tunicata TaxID=314281 RepID=UPI00273E1F7A|nr:EAL domain-containing protein [Pseudoalteromonas tunicata]MDP4984104.1 EAL domain-containing protein [Pseudoalteromonas tunicata]